MATELEGRTLRRITWRIVPFVMLLYFIADIDRVNIGFAALTMNKELGFSSGVFGFGAGVFFLGYFLCEVPSNVILEKVGARIWIARVMITWGIISGMFAFIKGELVFIFCVFCSALRKPASFRGLSFISAIGFLRVAGRKLFRSLWLRRQSRSYRIPISGALLEMHGVLGLSGWQWMFLLEAIPAVLLGFVVLGYMTDRPEKATWLKDDEREWLVNEMNAERAAKAATAAHSIWRGLANPRVLALSLIYFGTSAGLYTLGIWAPQIIKEFGLSTMQVGLLNAVPPTVAIIAMILWAMHSDRTGERTWHVILACVAAAVGLALAGSAESVVSVVAALTLVNIGITSAKPPLWSMPTMFLSGSAAAAGIATINSIGNLGGFVGPTMIGWIKDLTGSFLGGLYFVAGLLVVSAVLTFLLSRSQRVAAGTEPIKS